MNSDNKYNYIIAGMGCAGLSLAMQLKNSSVAFNKVLIVDRDLKNTNDRTWCFWTKEKNNWFDGIPSKSWGKFLFKSDKLNKEIILAPYEYRMIKGIDFYNYCISIIKSDERFKIITAEIKEINTQGKEAVLTTSSLNYSADYIFNSAFRTLDKKKNHINYTQHFKGWLVETEQETFNVDCPVFMDFTVEQHNDCRFVYTIPISKTRALVEYTGFSKKSLSDEDYDAELKSYLLHHNNIKAYSILETEKGEIPMVESEFVNPFGLQVINIGTAGGSSKPSSGYTFYFIQKNIQNIVAQLEKKVPKLASPKRKNRFLLYDRVLLEVIDKNEIQAKDIFTDLFGKNNAQNLLAFLNEESSLGEEVAIMNSVSKKHFIKASLKKLLN